MDKKIVDHSHVLWASTVGTALTTSSFSNYHLASIYLTKATASRDEKHLSLGASNIRDFKVYLCDPCVKRNTYLRIEAAMKWSFCKGHFQSHFLEWNHIIMDRVLTTVCCYLSILQYVSIGLGNGLEADRHKPITWSNEGVTRPQWTHIWIIHGNNCPW